MASKTNERLAYNKHLAIIEIESQPLTNLSFSFQEHVADPSSYGIHVVDRKFVSVEESVTSLARIMLDFTQLSRRQRIIMRNRQGMLCL